MDREDVSIQVAVVISLLLHMSAYSTWYFRDSLARIGMLAPLARMAQAIAGQMRSPAKPAAPAEQTITFVDVAPQPQPVAPPLPPERPHTFIETDPSQQSDKEPEKADYYSDKPSIATNPDNPTQKQSETPYIEGHETRMPGTEDRARGHEAQPAAPPTPPQPAVSTPALPAPKPAVKPPDADKPKELPDQGLKVEKPKPTQVAMLPPEQQPKPALQILAAPPLPAVAPVPGLPGAEAASAKSKLNAAGVPHRGITAFNVASSPFGEYDKKIVQAVRSRWYALIDRYGIYERTGEVTLYFELYDDGSVHNLDRKSNSAGEILALYCEKAIVDSAPFDPLPAPLRVLVGAEPREVNFTFYY